LLIKSIESSHTSINNNINNKILKVQDNETKIYSEEEFYKLDFNVQNL